jgi:metallo-beta-lactamase class B
VRSLVLYAAAAWIVLSAACASSTPTPSGLRIEKLSDDVELLRVTEHVWIHVSDDQSDRWGTIPANGLIVIDKGVGMLVDTGWKPSQARLIAEFAEKELSSPIRHVVLTHSHKDRMGGLPGIAKPDLVVHAHELTARAVEKLGLGVKIVPFSDEDTVEIGDHRLELFYPGPGHTKDNIVVWLPDEHILFAGCLVKSAKSAELGNREDAVIRSWPMSVLRTLERYGVPPVEEGEGHLEHRHAELVIPGHGPPGNINLLHHTLGLLEQDLSVEKEN